MTRSAHRPRGHRAGHRWDGRPGRGPHLRAHGGPGRHDPRRGPGRTAAVVLCAVLGVTLVVGAVTVAAVYLLVRLLPYLVLAAVALGAFVWARSRLRDRRDRSASAAAPAGPTTATTATAQAAAAEQAWRRARADFQRVRAEYAAHETDPMAVLRRPALSDVSVPSTARFVDAFAAAQALDTDGHPGEPFGASYVDAVAAARRAWHAAVDAADRIRLSGLGTEERRTVERVLKLLTTARDSDSEPERLAAYTRARSELDRLDRAGVVHLPRPARAHLDAKARGALPGEGPSALPGEGPSALPGEGPSTPPG